MTLTKSTNRMTTGAIANVLDFGAVGDGITDDTAAIQAAINSSANSIYIPEGDYVITGITIPSATTITGDGGGITAYTSRLIYAGSGVAVDLSGTSGTPTRKSVLRDFKIDCTGAATAAVKLTSAREHTLERVGVHDNGTAAKGFYLEGQVNFGVYINTFTQCEAVGFTHGLYVDGDITNSGTLRANSNAFDRCRFDSNTTGVLVRGCDTVDFYGTHCETNTTGVVVEGYSDGSSAIRVNYFGGYLENTTADIDSTDASPGGNGGIRFYGTRFIAVAAGSILNSDVTRGQLRVDTVFELTIASGEVTITQAFHKIDTEADASTDDLVTINGSLDGSLLFLRAENSARTVVVKDNTGNINLAGGDFSLTATNDVLMLMYDGSISRWLEVGRNNNA